MEKMKIQISLTAREYALLFRTAKERDTSPARPIGKIVREIAGPESETEETSWASSRN